MTRFKLFREFFLLKGLPGTYVFKLGHFCGEMLKFYHFFRVVLLQIHFGSGAARIRNDFFPDPDFARSFGLNWIRIHNTGRRYNTVFEHARHFRYHFKTKNAIGCGKLKLGQHFIKCASTAMQRRVMTLL
jgi:hypothetical protein